MINLPALKLSQFGITFYQAAISATEIEKLVKFEIISYGDGDKERHRKGKRGKPHPRVNWSVLEERIQRSAEAFQRPIIGKKIEELVKFYEERREHRDLPAVPGAVLLVSEKHLNFVPKSGNTGLLELPEEEGILRTLDGQHRLLALHALATSNLPEIHSLSVPAVIFDALQPAQAVEMFVTINTKHTRLKPDLIVALAGKKLYPDKKTALAHDILRMLNQREDSPLHHDIKILGVGPGKISQAPLAAEMARIFDDLEAAGLRAASAFYEDAKQFFLNYFKQISRLFSTAWSGRKYSIKSSLALRAFIRVAPTVVAQLRKHRAGVEDARAIGDVISPWANHIGDRRFETEELWKERGGPGSVERLAQELRNAIAE